MRVNPTAVVVHLSGSRRGKTERLSAEVIRLGTAADAEIRLPADESGSLAPAHATLHRQDEAYELRVEPGQAVRVNGDRVSSRVLASEDLIEVGDGRALLRFRLYPAGSSSYKSMREAFADCVDCARYGSSTALGRVLVLGSGIPVEVATQVAPWSRWLMATSMVVIVAVLVALATTYM